MFPQGTKGFIDFRADQRKPPAPAKNDVFRRQSESPVKADVPSCLSEAVQRAARTIDRIEGRHKRHASYQRSKKSRSPSSRSREERSQSSDRFSKYRSQSRSRSRTRNRSNSRKKYRSRSRPAERDEKSHLRNRSTSRSYRDRSRSQNSKRYRDRSESSARKRSYSRGRGTSRSLSRGRTISRGQDRSRDTSRPLARGRTTSRGRHVSRGRGRSVSRSSSSESNKSNERRSRSIRRRRNGKVSRFTDAETNSRTNPILIPDRAQSPFLEDNLSRGALSRFEPPPSPKEVSLSPPDLGVYSKDNTGDLYEGVANDVVVNGQPFAGSSLKDRRTSSRSQRVPTRQGSPVDSIFPGVPADLPSLGYEAPVIVEASRSQPVERRTRPDRREDLRTGGESISGTVRIDKQTDSRISIKESLGTSLPDTPRSRERLRSQKNQRNQRRRPSEESRTDTKYARRDTGSSKDDQDEDLQELRRSILRLKEEIRQKGNTQPMIADIHQDNIKDCVRKSSEIGGIADERFSQGLAINDIGNGRLDSDQLFSRRSNSPYERRSYITQAYERRPSQDETETVDVKRLAALVAAASAANFLDPVTSAASSSKFFDSDVHIGPNRSYMTPEQTSSDYKHNYLSTVSYNHQSNEFESSKIDHSQDSVSSSQHTSSKGRQDQHDEIVATPDMDVESEEDRTTNLQSKPEEKYAAEILDFLKLVQKRDQQKEKLSILKLEMSRISKLQADLMCLRRKNANDDVIANQMATTSRLYEDAKRRAQSFSSQTDILNQEVFRIPQKIKILAVEHKSRFKDSLVENLIESTTPALRNNCKFVDRGGYYCSFCKKEFRSISILLTHLHSDVHKINSKQASERPWTQSEKWQPNDQTDDSVPSVKVPAKGAQFLMGLTGFYCRLCNEMYPDHGTAEEHVLSNEHNTKYREYITVNSFYERRLQLEKETFLHSMAMNALPKMQKPEAAHQDDSQDSSSISNFLYQTDDSKFPENYQAANLPTVDNQTARKLRETLLSIRNSQRPSSQKGGIRLKLLKSTTSSQPLIIGKAAPKRPVLQESTEECAHETHQMQETPTDEIASTAPGIFVPSEDELEDF